MYITALCFKKEAAFVGVTLLANKWATDQCHDDILIIANQM